MKIQTKAACSPYYTILYHLYRLMVTALWWFPKRAARPTVKHGREIHDHIAFVGALCTHKTSRISPSTLGVRKSNWYWTAAQLKQVKLIASEILSKRSSSAWRNTFQLFCLSKAVLVHFEDNLLSDPCMLTMVSLWEQIWRNLLFKGFSSHDVCGVQQTFSLIN